MEFSAFGICFVFRYSFFGFTTPPVTESCYDNTDMTTDETSFDHQLLATIQRAVPLVERPYAQLAAELGVAPSYIANIEQGQKGISLDKLVDFCKYLNIGLSDLLPIESPDDSEAKEEIIRETVDLLRGLETTQVRMFKTMVAGVSLGG